MDVFLCSHPAVEISCPGAETVRLLSPPFNLFAFPRNTFLEAPSPSASKPAPLRPQFRAFLTPLTTCTPRWITPI